MCGGVCLQAPEVWDVKAQLPHGLAAIRRHLEEKDNVPLLVSLFTDSKQPQWVCGMMQIMEENGEVCGGVQQARACTCLLL